MAALDKTQLHLGHLLVIVLLNSARFMYQRIMGISESSNFPYRKGQGHSLPPVKDMVFSRIYCGHFKIFS